MSTTKNHLTRPHAEPRPSGRVRKSDRTRAEILDAALAFLWSNPFRDMTVVTLMKTTALSRSTFYQYFKDVYDVLEELLEDLEGEILRGAGPWFVGVGDVDELLRVSLGELVRICHERGPILRAVADAAPADERLDQAWMSFLGRFDAAVAARIEADQRQGLIPPFPAGPVAVALNRLDAYSFIHAFGKRPRQPPGPVLDALTRVWVQTLYPEPTGPGDSVRPRIRTPDDGPASSSK